MKKRFLPRDPASPFTISSLPAIPLSQNTCPSLTLHVFSFSQLPCTLPSSTALHSLPPSCTLLLHILSLHSLQFIAFTFPPITIQSSLLSLHIPQLHTMHFSQPASLFQAHIPIISASHHLLSSLLSRQHMSPALLLQAKHNFCACNIFSRSPVHHTYPHSRVSFPPLPSQTCSGKLSLQILSLLLRICLFVNTALHRSPSASCNHRCNIAQVSPIPIPFPIPPPTIPSTVNTNISFVARPTLPICLSVLHITYLFLHLVCHSIIASLK